MDQHDAHSDEAEATVGSASRSVAALAVTSLICGGVAALIVVLGIFGGQYGFPFGYPIVGALLIGAAIALLGRALRAANPSLRRRCLQLALAAAGVGGVLLLLRIAPPPLGLQLMLTLGVTAIVTGAMSLSRLGKAPKGPESGFHEAISICGLCGGAVGALLGMILFSGAAYGG